MKSKNRISLLDSFRCIAVMMVVLYHYFSEKTNFSNLYPFKQKFINYFQYGYLGVEFFFIISGYVIFMTLEKCENKKEFFLKRFMRLFPLLFLCSILTFIFPFILDYNNNFSESLHPKATGFFPSLTFSDIIIWNQIFHKKIEYIDNVYWSLGVEVKFYIFSAILYFFNKEKFIRNWLIFATVSTLFFLLSFKLGYYNISQIISIFIIAKYVGFFSLGIFFYKLSKRETVGKDVLVLMIFVLAGQIFQLKNIETVYLFSFIVLFVLFIYKPTALSILNFPLFSTIGVVSYPYYLIHSTIGLLIMLKLASIFNLNDSAWLLYLIIIPFLIYISYLIHKYIEIPVSVYLKKHIVTKKNI